MTHSGSAVLLYVVHFLWLVDQFERVCGCYYSEKEMEQTEGVLSWKQSRKSVRTCEWNCLPFARDLQHRGRRPWNNFITYSSRPNTGCAPQMCLSQAVCLQMIFSVVFCGGLGCWEQIPVSRERRLIGSFQIWHTNDFHHKLKPSTWRLLSGET